MIHSLKRHSVTTAAVLSASLFILTGCGGAGSPKADSVSSDQKTDSSAASETASVGGYIEEELSLPEGITSVEALQAQEDGSLSMICGLFDGEKSNYSLASSKDNGKTWELKPLNEILSLDAEAAEGLLTFALGKNGQGFYGRFIEQGDDFFMECYYISPEGDVKILDLGDRLTNSFATDAFFDSDGNLYLSVLSGGVLMIDPAKGEILHTFEEGNSAELAGISGSCLITVAGSSIHCYDTKTKKPAEDYAVLTSQISDTTETLERNNSSSVPLLFLEDEDGLFFLNSHGLYHYTFGGTVVEQLIDGSRNSISFPSTGFTSLTRGADGSFYLGTTNFASSDSTGHIYHYTYSEDAVLAASTTLTVYTLEENGFLQQAASLFQAKHPDIQLQIQTGMSGEDGITRTDALKTLNTEIMAEKGPDILLLDGLSTDTYAEKGLLMDLSSVLEDAELLDNIRNAYTEEDGAIYSMPVSFGIPMIQGQAEDMEKITDLSSLADVIESHSEEYGVGKGYSDYNYYLPGSFAMTPKMLLSTLAPVCQNAWITEDGVLDESALTDFLTQAGRIYQAEKEALTKFQKKYPEYIEGDYGSSEPFLPLAYSSVSVLRKINLLTLGALYSPEDLAYLDTVEKLESSTLSSRIWNTQVSSQFLPVNETGISTKAAHPEEAQEFIRFLFSEEGQSASKEYGFPVLKKLYEDPSYWTMGKPGEMISSLGDYNILTKKDFNLDILAAEEDTVQRIQEWGKSLTIPAASDAIIQEAVTEAGVMYLKEELTLAEATERIIKEIRLYLAE